MKEHVFKDSEITLDGISDLKIFQRKRGYRFSIDSPILAHFPELSKKVVQLADLGAGSGVVGLILARRFPWLRVYLVELQKGLTELARKNVSANGLDERVQVIEADIRALGVGRSPLLGSGSMDAVVTNPPYRPPDTGRLSHGDERAVARHEIKIDLEGVIATSKRILKNGGRFFIVYDPSRLSDLIYFMKKACIEPKRLCFVHSVEGSPAEMVLVEGVKSGGVELRVEPPLYIYDKKGGYTERVRRMIETGMTESPKRIFDGK